ncbi:Serine/threonine-protein kinase [Meredithblackwellia eburnea MCA 4105]
MVHTQQQQADTKALQDDEIEVLQSIYADDYKTVVSRTAWKSVNAIHEFQIKVRAAEVEEELKDRVSVDVHFKLPARYPNVVPTILLENPKGLSSAQVLSLSQLLQSTAHSLVGGVMIYELCSTASGFITDRHQVSQRGKGLSLEEQRRIREEEEGKATALATASAAALRAQQEAAEAARLSMLISEDVRRREELRASRDRELQKGDPREGLSVMEDRVVPMIIEGRAATVKLGLSGGESWLGQVVPAEVCVGSDTPIPGSAQVFDILAPYFLTAQGKRKLNKVLTDLERSQALPPHGHLVPLLGSHLALYSPTFLPSPFPQRPLRHGDGYTLVVLSLPPRNSQSLQSLLLACGELRTDKALVILSQVVTAVDYLHQHQIVHKSIRPTNVLIGGGGASVEVGIQGAAWWQRLVDLNKSDPWASQSGAEEEFPESWICPEARDDTFVYDRSRDMWDVGVLFAQILFGLDVTRRYASPAELIRGLTRTSSVYKILHDLLLTESRKRPSAAKLAAQLSESSSGTSSSNITLSTTPQSSIFTSVMKNNHTNNHRPITQPPTPLWSPQQPLQQQLSRSIDGAAPSGFFWQPRPSGSRYRSEFEELEFLGRGGGGQVVKARNRLDGHLYAVKKIRLPHGRAQEEKILREVTIWSRMNHPNIVRYHTSWVETDENPQATDTDAESQLTGTETGESREISTEEGSTEEDAASDSEDDSEEPSDFEDDGLATGHHLDIDLGLDDFDDNDFLSVGHSKSVSYPSIHFGNEDDVSRAGSTAANSPVISRRPSVRPLSPTGSPVPRFVRTLYIQMEYVEKLTLKEAIDEGESEVDSWKHMFQILSAMLHFTSLNIIHRDLKPSNIFLDVKGDVRIGDFGLAVNQGLADAADHLLSIESAGDEVDLTSGVGTSLYIAPETLSRARSDRSVKYSNKIDMYSLGIVFFELWHPFQTGMERIQVLRELRKPEIIFPPTWDAIRLARHTKIVRWCLAHDPELRASPKDLLNSELLPPRVGDDSIEETIRLLSHSGTTHAQTLITALFNQSDEDRMRKDFSYDFYDGEGAKVDNDPYGELVRTKLSQVFRQKGAVCMDSPLLMPHSQVYASRKPVRLLDSDGTVVCLPFQLNIPFCRMVARDTTLTRLKRWTIAPIYRASSAGGQPRAVLNAAFDIVSDAVTAASEAECLYVMEEVMAAFPFSGETVHVVNHSKILEAVIDRVPSKRKAAVLEILVQHSRLQRSWPKTAVELLKIQGMTKAIVDDIGIMDFNGPIDEVKKRVLSTIPRLKHLVQEGFDELKDIVTISLNLGVKNIKICPLLATNWDFHRDGALFETHHVKGKIRDVIAAGGRFDDVVSRLAAPDVRYSGRCPHVVGASLSVAKLSLAASESNAVQTRKLSTLKESNRSYGPWAVRRCDVYVVSFAPKLIERRLDIVKDLWKAGIKADLMYDDDFLSLTPEQLVSACRREGILWLVMVKPGSDRPLSVDEPDTILKIKSVLKGTEEEVPRSELTSWIVNELRDQALVDERQSSHASSHETQVDLSLALPEQRKSTQEFHPILIDGDVRHKGKHKQRTMIIHRAQKNVENAVAAASEAPVFAVDVEGPAFKAMCSSAAWITDDEAYRPVVQSAPPSKRDYLNSIRQTIRRHKSKVDSFWLFSLRDDRSVLLTFDSSI